MTDNQIKKIKEIQENPLVNVVELKFINKILYDNTIYLDTKISFQHFTDPFCQVLYSILGQKISQLGEFKPLLHLKDFCEDESRMDSYSKVGYPLEITDPESICKYLETFTDFDIRAETLEYEIQKEYQKRALEESAYEIISVISDSKASIKELTAKISFKLDNLLYDSDRVIQSKSTAEVADDMLAYLNSDEVDEYIPTGVDVIDRQSGGTTIPAVICWVANAREYCFSLLKNVFINNNQLILKTF